MSEKDYESIVRVMFGGLLVDEQFKLTEKTDREFAELLDREIIDHLKIGTKLEEFLGHVVFRLRRANLGPEPDLRHHKFMTFEDDEVHCVVCGHKADDPSGPHNKEC